MGLVEVGGAEEAGETPGLAPHVYGGMQIQVYDQLTVSPTVPL